MRTRLAFAAGLLAGVVSIAACETEHRPPTAAPDVQETDDGPRITITDADGKVWDITHAVTRYGFDPRGFQYGIGAGTIPPVFDPEFVSPGERNYPNPGITAPVLGAEFEGHVRAYSIAALSRHEVINDGFGEAHLAVAY